ncbi:O-succinylbenzoic acid--CoA ligase [Citrobacter koseri]|uniref:O-succinylbenzoic acid--CoA ligase n=1 Tax=Citrobacter koseri TaxID=545 RepID=A0A3S4KJH9_CITKO|nr:O-succinylbenzoic acid--CoA ligase [Citrobacter koseri]
MPLRVSLKAAAWMLRAWNHPQTLLAWLALLQCGARVLPVNPQLPQPLLDALLPDLTLRFALLLEEENTFPALQPLQMQQEAGEHAADWQPTRLSSMTLTSGSTGLPKAAVHTCQAHLASAEGVLSLNAVCQWGMTGCYRCRCFTFPARALCGAGCLRAPE